MLDSSLELSDGEALVVGGDAPWALILDDDEEDDAEEISVDATADATADDDAEDDDKEKEEEGKLGWSRMILSGATPPPELFSLFARVSGPWTAARFWLRELAASECPVRAIAALLRLSDQRAKVLRRGDDRAKCTLSSIRDSRAPTESSLKTNEYILVYDKYEYKMSTRTSIYLCTVRY